MVRATLGGRHTHGASDGTEVHVWLRDGKYLARGSSQGQRFGQKLGADVQEAEIRLRALLGEIDRGAFRRASDRTQQAIRTGLVPKLTLAELANTFLADVRGRKGKNTAETYADRLAPGLEFAERHPKRWPFADRIDRAFATELKTYLFQRRTTANGQALATTQRMAPGQILNVMGCWGTMIHWAARQENHLLPLGFANPFTHDVVGQRPRRDPLAPPTFPLDLRVQLVGVMDAWQLACLALPLVLPERPEDFVGLLVSEVDRGQRFLHFGTRCAGDDTTKAGVSFHVPYPPELDSILGWLIGSRTAGPLLRTRNILVRGKVPALVVATPAELDARFDKYLARFPADDTTCVQDRKRYFRRFLLKLGGVSTDTLAREFHAVLRQVRPELSARFYEIKGSTTTDMKDAGVDYITRMYLTGHALSDEILAAYESQRLREHTARYYLHLAPLLAAIVQRADQLGIAS